MNSSPTPLVTLFIPVYKTYPFVQECLESVLQQVGGYETEIIVIDDASPDNSKEVVRPYAEMGLVRYVQHPKNRGAIYTWNEGFQLAKGKYVARIDSDDRLRSHFLSSTVPILEKHSEVGMVYGDIALINDAGQITSQCGNVNRSGQPAIGNELKAILKTNYIPAPTVLARREAWMLSVPMPDWLGFCDWYQSVQMARQWDFAFVDDVLADYRVHEGNMHSSMILDRSGEKTTFRLIEEIFSESGHLFSWKDRRKILMENYRHYGDSYFGAGMREDARRHYTKALMNGCQFDPTFRRWLATFVPQKHYEAMKMRVKGISS